MKTDKNKLLTKYAVCVGVALLIMLAVFAIKGFFTDDTATNLNVLADGFTVPGMLLTLFAGLQFVGGEGAFLGIGFVLKSIVQAFIPMGRRNHEFYGQYRERKMSKLKKQGDRCVLVVGLVFLAIGIAILAIWYTKYYQMPA